MPTHINKDRFALDFSQNGCEAYAQQAVAASAGRIMLAQEDGYNGGYGTQVLVQNEEGILTRYAHLIPGSIPLVRGTPVFQGELLGLIGNSGLVAGLACLEHPGTHLHFAMYDPLPDGSFAPYLPEPISGYVNLTEGKWYFSDNMPDPPEVLGESATSLPTLALTSSTIPTSVEEPKTITISLPLTGGGGGSGGGVSIVSPPESIPEPEETVSPVTTSTPASVASTTNPEASSSPPIISIVATATFNSSTLAIDLSWQPASNTSGTSTSSSSDPIIYQILKSDSPIAQTTSTSFSYPLADDDFGTGEHFSILEIDGDGNTTTIAFASTTIPNWISKIQQTDGLNSNGSWYDDNWYDLGTGFYGTILSLSLEGLIDNMNYHASHLWLDEYFDADYSKLSQTFTISDNAPFTAGIQKIKIGNLNIPLRPDKYYRLRTYQDFQNRSVILLGTAATGTAMWSEFIYGTGRVEHTYSFYPYLTFIMIPDYPPIDEERR